MPSFRDYQVEIAPPWLQRAKGAAYLRALGDAKNGLVDRLKQAVKARMPGLAPLDALAAIGSERQIERLPGETSAQYAARLQDAWTIWPWAGTAYGLLVALHGAGFTTAQLVTRRGWRMYLSGAGALVIHPIPGDSWTIVSDPAFWSGFQVLFPLPCPFLNVGAVVKTGGGVGTMIVAGVPYDPAALGVTIHTAGAPGAGLKINLTTIWPDGLLGPIEVPANGIIEVDYYATTYGMWPGCGAWLQFSGTFAQGATYTAAVGASDIPDTSSGQADQIRRLAAKCKPAHSTFCGAVVQTLGELWGYPEGTWADPGTWGTADAVLWAP